MSGEVILRLGGYSEIDIYKFTEWLHHKYFTTNMDSEDLYLDRFDVDILVSIDDINNTVSVQADLIDTNDVKWKLSESLKREIHELNRGN